MLELKGDGEMAQCEVGGMQEEMLGIVQILHDVRFLAGLKHEVICSFLVIIMRQGTPERSEDLFFFFFF